MILVKKESNKPFDRIHVLYTGEKRTTFGIEVSNIPAEATSETLLILFESHRITGIVNARVSEVSFFPRDHSKAVVSFFDYRGSVFKTFIGL